jgi:putative drug exporter of the RND superfamily
MLRHPRRVLAVVIVVVLALAVLGLNVEQKLSPTSLDISGTASSRANRMLREHFGPTALFAVLLQGPARAIDEQGPRLVRALRAAGPAVSTLSPWDRGSVGRLRPGPRRALIIVDFHVDIATAVNHTVPELNEILARGVRPPLRATQSGFPTLSKALQDESIAASERGELIAIPFLLLILMLVFRSPLAAAIPLAFGAVTVLTSRGVLTIVTNWFSVDAFALLVCTMMGLALGVDYALLMVSRFREELAGGAEPAAAAAATRKHAGRTTVFAGSTLMISMLVALFVVPGALLVSLAATVILVVAISVLVATIAGPAVLTLLGPNINRWRIGPAQVNGSSRLMTLVSAALRRPALVSLAIGAIVLILAAPAIGLKTGPPSQAQLAPGNQSRKDAELIDRTIAPGFDAPFVIIASTDHGTITQPDRLAALSRWQDKIAALPGVQVVIGPQQVSRAVAPLRETGSTLLAGKGGPAESLARLGRNLNRAAGGVAQLRDGLSQATYGAGLLAGGSSGAGDGAATIAAGLARAAAGGERAVAALDTFASGTRRLAHAQRQAASGAAFVKSGLSGLGASLANNALPLSRKLQKGLNDAAHNEAPALQTSAQSSEERLNSAVGLLEGMTVGKSDPNYGAALEAVRQGAAAGLPASLATLQTRLVALAEESGENSFWWVTAVKELRRTTRSAEELSHGLERIRSADEKLAEGSARLAAGAVTLSGGLTRLAPGAGALAAGVSRLAGGASTLERKLAAGYHRSHPLQSGLRRGAVRVVANGKRLRRQAGRLRRSSPGLFDSGYFVLSALDGASPRLRRQASQAVDLENGGQAATLLVFTHYTFNTPGSIALNKQLEGDASALGREAGLSTGVAGGAAQLNDYSQVTRERIPILVAVITIATFLILMIILRAIPLAAIAVGLNLATVGVAFGVLTLLFNVPAGWPLGGNTYIDAVGAMMMFGIIFGLSIDYAVFLLTRMREHHEANGDNAAAIQFGLEKTARVITGAAAIMMAVFIVFAGAPIANVSQLGTGLTVAVLLDATVVRIVFLPALMLLLGDRVWWLPGWLERVIPRFDV